MPEASASSGTAASARQKKKQSGGVQGSARKGKGDQKRWNNAHGTATAGKKPAASFTGGRSIIFTVGGMAYSEMRVARDIMAQEGREIIFGTTAFITAKDFVEDLSKLS
jgi:Sec1 family